MQPRYAVFVDGQEMINLQGSVWDGRESFRLAQAAERDASSIELFCRRADGLLYKAAGDYKGAGYPRADISSISL